MTAGIENGPARAPVQLNGPVIRFAMRARGLSQNALAVRIRVSEATVSRALSGQPTTAAVAMAIHAEFGRRLKIEEIVSMPGISPGLPDGAVDMEPEPAVEPAGT